MKPPHEGTREKILVTGPPGTGKSSAWLHIARLSQKSKSDARFYVVDTDDAIARMLEDEYADLSNVEVNVALGQISTRLGEYLAAEPRTAWGKYMDEWRRFCGQAETGDWVIVDMIQRIWDEMQSAFSTLSRGVSIDELFVAMRAESNRGGAFAQDTDWPVINKMYQAWMSVMRDSKAHLYAATPLVEMRSDSKADQALQKVLGASVKPAGQKFLSHEYHDVLRFSQPRLGEWQMESMKARGRADVEAQPIKDFALSFLVRARGWKVV